MAEAPRKNPLGWEFHSAALVGLKTFDEKLEDHYTWIQEALVEAKKTLEKYTSICSS